MSDQDLSLFEKAKINAIANRTAALVNTAYKKAVTESVAKNKQK